MRYRGFLTLCAALVGIVGVAWAAEIDSLSTTDANNTTRWAESIPLSSVNNSARELEAIIARWARDFGDGCPEASGTDTLTVSANRTISTYYDGLTLCTRITAANTGPVKVNVDSGGEFKLVTPNNAQLSGGELQPDSRIFYQWSEPASAWKLLAIPSTPFSTSSLSALATAASDDDVLVLDSSASNAERTLTIARLLEVINTLIEDTDPDSEADFLLSYDTSASTVKKVKIDSFSPATAYTVQVFSSSTTYTKPSGARSLRVRVVGPGGGGGGGATSQTAGGGGAGAYCEKALQAVAVAATVAVTVGTGGSGGSAAGNGSGGSGASSFGSHCSAGAGNGGTAAGTGGAGGTATGGDLNIDGGGGGSGGPASTYTSRGGVSAFGGPLSSAIGNQSASTVPGAGGNGAGGSGATGGDGAPGIVIVEEFY